MGRHSSRAAIREVFGRINEGEGNERSNESGATGLLGAVEGAVDELLDAVEVVVTLRFEVKNLSNRSKPFAMIESVSWTN